MSKDLTIRLKCDELSIINYNNNKQIFAVLSEF